MIKKLAILLLLITLPQQSIFSNQYTLQMDEEREVEIAKKWKNKVYLATYPRSGNHWVRYLIEEATHIATSSSYTDPDPPHLTRVFPWGGYCCHRGYEGSCRYPRQGEAVVIKTHYPVFALSKFENLPYRKAIRIVRHPIDAIYSFYLYSHSDIAHSLIKRRFLLTAMDSWIRFQQHWDRAENVITIRYEDLYQDPARYLKLILDEIGYQTTEEDIERAVTKYPPKGGLYKHTAHFTADDLARIQNKLGPLLEQFGYQ